MDSPTSPAGHSGHDPHAGEPATWPELGVDIESLVTEDDEPVDMLSQKQQRLLTEPLYSSWAGPGGGRPFLASANVGVFPEPRNPAIVPDMFLSLDVRSRAHLWETRHRSYFVWEFGKPPDLVVEIVSNPKGGEVEEKRQRYAGMGVRYYVIYDPWHAVMRDDVRAYCLTGGRYERQAALRFPELGLGLVQWEGEFEDERGPWLRWTDEHGALIPTGKEKAAQAEQERVRAEQARQQAEQELVRAEQERRQAEQHRARAEQELVRAQQERAQAEQEHRQAEQHRARAEQERRRAERLEALLRRTGFDPKQR